MNFRVAEVFKAILSGDVDWKPFSAFPLSVRLAIVVREPSQPGPYAIRVKSTLTRKMIREITGLDASPFRKKNMAATTIKKMEVMAEAGK